MAPEGDRDVVDGHRLVDVRRSCGGETLLDEPCRDRHARLRSTLIVGVATNPGDDESWGQEEHRTRVLPKEFHRGGVEAGTASGFEDDVCRAFWGSAHLMRLASVLPAAVARM